MIEPYKQKALTRLKRLRGQIEGVSKMIEEDKYCIDILTQIRALDGALKSVSSMILESHLETCGAKHLSSNDPEKKARFIKDLVKACDLSNR